MGSLLRARACAHHGRATAPIIDTKSSLSGRRARPSFARFSNLARLEWDMPALDGTSLAQHLATFWSGVCWWVITHHQAFNFQPDLDGQIKRAWHTHTDFSTPQRHMPQAGAKGCTITWPSCWTFGPRNGREHPVENGSTTGSGDGLRVAVQVPEKSLHFLLFQRLRRVRMYNQINVGSEHVRNVIFNTI